METLRNPEMKRINNRELAEAFIDEQIKDFSTGMKAKLKLQRWNSNVDKTLSYSFGKATKGIVLLHGFYVCANF